MLNNPEKLGASSFRPTQNADGVSENHHTGINRLVKLSLVIEGKLSNIINTLSLYKAPDAITNLL